MELLMPLAVMRRWPVVRGPGAIWALTLEIGPMFENLWSKRTSICSAYTSFLKNAEVCSVCA